MKKNHQYYNPRDNLWNHTYFTCPKVARFYHQPQAFFERTCKSETHPSPEQLRDVEIFERLERKEAKIALEKASDVSRLKRRRFERELVSRISASSEE